MQLLLQILCRRRISPTEISLKETKLFFRTMAPQVSDASSITDNIGGQRRVPVYSCLYIDPMHACSAVHLRTERRSAWVSCATVEWAPRRRGGTCGWSRILRLLLLYHHVADDHQTYCRQTPASRFDDLYTFTNYLKTQVKSRQNQLQSFYMVYFYGHTHMNIQKACRNTRSAVLDAN
jgi:hypothetical protein